MTVFRIPQLPTEQRLEELATRFSQLDKTAILTFIMLLKVAGDLDSAMTSHYAKYGLSYGRFRLLIQLDRNEGEGMHPSELASCVCVKNATVTGLIDGMVKDGLVRREGDPKDRRASRIRLTLKGKRLLKAILPDHFTRLARLMKGLSRAERATLTALLAKVSEGLPAFLSPAGGIEKSGRSPRT
jgi:DNA-binding MarR family transcriptional regulator